MGPGDEDRIAGSEGASMGTKQGTADNAAGKWKNSQNAMQCLYGHQGMRSRGISERTEDEASGYGGLQYNG